jgi:hypothetical protein
MTEEFHLFLDRRTKGRGSFPKPRSTPVLAHSAFYPHHTAFRMRGVCVAVYVSPNLTSSVSTFLLVRRRRLPPFTILGLRLLDMLVVYVCGRRFVLTVSSFLVSREVLCKTRASPYPGNSCTSLFHIVRPACLATEKDFFIFCFNTTLCSRACSGKGRKSSQKFSLALLLDICALMGLAFFLIWVLLFGGLLAF